jgi:signal transduction histidine kinase
VHLSNLIRASFFRLTLLYTGVFCASALALLGFIYWSTVAVIERQTIETIEAEIRGLAEQYNEQGLARLIEIIEERSGAEGDDDNIYLLTDPLLVPLTGNLSNWPKDTEDPGNWLRLTLSKREQDGFVPHEVRARSFILPGGYRLLVGRDMHEKRRFRAIVVGALVWSLGGALVLALTGGLFVTGRMLSRVDQVSRTARKIMDGDLSRRMEKSGSGDEFDHLADSLNAMLDRIERLMIGMRLSTDSIAHDLRSPLTRLKSRIELALRNPPEVDRDREALANVLSQTDAALAVFDSLLRIATAEAGMDAVDFKSFDLAALAQDVTELYRPLAEEKGIELELSADPSAEIRGQHELMAQAIANVLDNAVKFTSAGGRISVVVRHQNGAVVLTVADSGPGIPRADRQKVLERFVKLEGSRTGPGTGLGLSLVAAVAKLHGAVLRLGDNDPGLEVEIRCRVSPTAVGETPD